MQDQIQYQTQVILNLFQDQLTTDAVRRYTDAVRRYTDAIRRCVIILILHTRYSLLNLTFAPHGKNTH